MKKLVALFATSALALQSTAYAEVLMNWKRLPLPIELKVKQERVIFVDKSVKVGYPQELEGENQNSVHRWCRLSKSTREIWQCSFAVDGY